MKSINKGRLFHGEKLLLSMKRPAADPVHYYVFSKINDEQLLIEFIDKMEDLETEIIKLGKHLQVVIETSLEIPRDNILGNLYKWNPELSRDWWCMHLGRPSDIVFYKFDVFGEIKEIEVVNEPREDPQVKQKIQEIYQYYLETPAWPYR